YAGFAVGGCTFSASRYDHGRGDWVGAAWRRCRHRTSHHEMILKRVHGPARPGRGSWIQRYGNQFLIHEVLRHREGDGASIAGDTSLAGVSAAAGPSDGNKSREIG